MITNSTQHNHPWQNGPTELIRFALERLHLGTDFDKRIAFLMLDIGVETLFRTYLVLPKAIIKTEMAYPTREKAAKGNFHELVEGVKNASGSKLKVSDFSHVRHYHKLRNTLYHQGNGINVSDKDTKEYATLVVRLLKSLLGIDLTQDLRKPEIEAEQKAELEKKSKVLCQRQAELNKHNEELKVLLLLALETVASRLVLPSFDQRLNKLINKYLIDQDSNIYKSDNILAGKFYPKFLNLIESSINDQALKNSLFSITKIKSFDKEIETPSILSPIFMGKHIATEIIQFSVLDIAAPIFERYITTYQQTEFLHMVLNNPWDDRETAYAEYMENSNQLISDINNACNDIREWLKEAENKEFDP